MAVEALIANELLEATRPRPFDTYGKLRIAHFTMPAITVAADANSTLKLTNLPFGAVRLYPNLSRISTSAFGVGRTLDIGYRKFHARPIALGEQAEDPDALVDGMDISSAVNAAALSNVLKYDFYSVNGVTLFATVLGDTIPIGATLSGFFVFATE